ncbi:MAG: hypothetical protein GXO99_05350 [Nitrospirae bacterium]|nr:hypothetical protein [Nitrospirota bacterium]
MFKKIWVMVISAFLLVSTMVVRVSAEEAKVSGSASVSVMSNYVWRGQKLSNSYVIQPSVGITYNNLGFNMWSNLDSDFNDDAEITETDLTVDYSFNIDNFGFDLGYIYYGLEGVNDTQEIFLSIAYDMFLNPTLTIYYDFDEGDGAFIVAAISESLPVINDLTLDLSASVSYNMNNKIMGFDSSGDDFSNFYNGEITASMSIPVTDSISIDPMLSYSFPLSNDAEDALQAISNDGDDDIIYGGFTVNIGF